MKMKLKTLFFILPVVLMLSSCNTSRKVAVAPAGSHDKILMAVAWYQNAPEMTALYYQGFNLAHERLDEAMATNKQSKPLAVVVDIDETMLDNSPFEVTLISNDDDQSGWYNWVAKSASKALPGALEFAKYAESKQVQIFYITNRDDNEHAATVQNLKNEGFPYATDDHVLTKSDLSYSSGNTSSKVSRRAKVSENHEIVLLIGDNLNDFSEVFEDRKINNGKAAVEQNRDQFGKKFIILPNPMYGAWEKPLYNYQNDLNNEEKARLLKSKLRND